VGKIEATENSKSKNVGKQRQMTPLRALWLLPPKRLLLQELASQDRPGFFDQHCASEDYDGCDDADGFERMRRGRSCFEPPSNAQVGSVTGC
jgi:hypothetical protein